MIVWSSHCTKVFCVANTLIVLAILIAQTHSCTFVYLTSYIPTSTTSPSARENGQPRTLWAVMEGEMCANKSRHNRT